MYKPPTIDPNSLFYISDELQFHKDCRELVPPQLRSRCENHVMVYCRADGSIEVTAGVPISIDEERYVEVWGGTTLYEGKRMDGKRVLGFMVCQHDLSKPRIEHPDMMHFPGQAYPGLGHPVTRSQVKRVEQFARKLRQRHGDLYALVYSFNYFHQYEVFLYDFGFHIGDEELYPQNKGIRETIKTARTRMEKAGLINEETEKSWARYLRERTWYAFDRPEFNFDLNNPPVMEKVL